MNELHRIYPKYKADKNDKDALYVLQSVTDFILNLVISLRSKSSGMVGHKTVSVNNFHFVFVVPTEWDYRIKQDILRPIFVATGLISEKDHPNRLLFFTKLESILQLIQHPRFGIHNRIEKSTQYLMCGLVQAEGTLLLNLCAFELKDCMVNTYTRFSLSSRVSKSEVVLIDFKEIQRTMETLLIKKGFCVSDKTNKHEVLQVTADFLLNQFLGEVCPVWCRRGIFFES